MQHFKFKKMFNTCLFSINLLLSGPLKEALDLQCSIEKLQLLKTLDASPFDEYATACVSTETLTRMSQPLLDKSNCKKTFAVEESFGFSNLYALYVRSTAEKEIEMLSMHHPVCECSWNSQDRCQECYDIKALKTIGSEGRLKILQLHEKRATAAENVREKRDQLLLLAKKAWDLMCSQDESYKNACSIAQEIGKQNNENQKSQKKTL